MKEREWLEHCQNLQNHEILEKCYLGRALAGKVGVISEGGKGNIPVLYATGASLAEAWENSLICLWVKGGFVRTQYDGKDNKGDYIVPPSKDSTMIVTIENPLSEPMIHRDFPGGLDALEEYRQEVLDGIKNSWVRDPKNPNDKRWEYTYNGRISEYQVPGLEKAIDQFEIMAQNIAKSPITRRAQVVTWKPWEDTEISDPACLQSIWARALREHPDSDLKLYSDEQEGKLKLNPNWRFRSRDSYGASFMNDFALIHLAEKLAGRISEIRKEPVELGRVVDFSDSFHIYGKDFESFLNRFGNSLRTRHFEEQEEYDPQARTWRSDSPVVIASFEEARKMIPLKIAEQNAQYAKGEGLTKGSSNLFKDEKK